MKEPETNFPLHLFHHGTNFKAYETMGAHAVTKNRKRGTACYHLFLKVLGKPKRTNE